MLSDCNTDESVKGHAKSLTFSVLGAGSAASPVPAEDAEKLSVMQ